MPSPFPGMDPWLEDPARWPDVHLRLIATLGDVLMEQVRPRYVVRADERVYLAEEEGGEPALTRPDLTVRGVPGAAPPAPAEGARVVAVPVLVPTVALAHEVRERYLEVRAPGSGRVVTVIEVLSPTNKRGIGSAGRQAYLAKRRLTLLSPAHLVEIDLLREGERVPMARPLPPAASYVVVSRAERRPTCEVYPVGLREPLPVFRVPLEGDDSVDVDLQSVLSTVYERAGYELDLDYGRPPVPPLEPSDAAWAAEALAAERGEPGS